jgi:hypothetical protein
MVNLPEFLSLVSKAAAGTLAATKEGSIGALDWYPGTIFIVVCHSFESVFGFMSNASATALRAPTGKVLHDTLTKHAVKTKEAETKFFYI